MQKEKIYHRQTINLIPHLLLGPKEHLEDLQIPLVQNLTVGLGIKDHISYFGLNYLISLQVNYNDSGYRYSSQSTFQSIPYFNSRKLYFSCKKRCISSSPLGIEAIGFIKTNGSDKSSGTPDIEILMVNHLINRDLKTLTNVGEAIYQKCFQNVEELIGIKDDKYNKSYCH